MKEPSKVVQPHSKYAASALFLTYTPLAKCADGDLSSSPFVVGMRLYPHLTPWENLLFSTAVYE